LITARDIRGLRARVRRYAHETGRTEFEALLAHCAWLGAIDPIHLTQGTAAWITEAYLMLTHEIARLQRDEQTVQLADADPPVLSRTVAGMSVTRILEVLDDLEVRPTDYGLPADKRWRSAVKRLPDAWIGSQHVEKYRLDFWGQKSMVERVSQAIERALFP
jgi:hypothetical protein